MTNVSPPSTARPERGCVRYDLRVRTVLGPAARARLTPRGECAELRRSTVFRFQLVRDCDLSELYELLLENGIEVISIRAAG